MISLYDVQHPTLMITVFVELISRCEVKTKQKDLQEAPEAQVSVEDRLNSDLYNCLVKLILQLAQLM